MAVPLLDTVLDAATSAGNDVERCLAFAAEFGRQLPSPGDGETAQRWSALAVAAAADLTAARVLEAHSDALAIRREAGLPDVAGTWGVFAAEAPGVALTADGGTLTGTKPWCSLGDRVDRALVTAREGEGRRLYAVDLRDASVRSDPSERWVARGLPNVTSVALHFDATPATPVGEIGWYLERSGFAWGGIGVAACWFGATTALQETLRGWADTHPGDLTGLALGTVDRAVAAARTVLRDAAADVDAGHADGATGNLLALRVRATVAVAVDTVLQTVAHATGPTPLAFDEAHARRVADLGLYVRQHHGERDLAALGTATLAVPSELDSLRRSGL